MTSLISCISEDLCLDESYVASVIRRSNRYYKDYSIPKKDGSFRSIAQASPELKTLQYWTVQNILKHFPVSESSFAYKRGDSIKRHAEFHKASRFLFHTDVKKFFPSINSELLSDVIVRQKQQLTSAGLWYEDLCDTIAKICFRYNRLCIGTVSSPVISNIVMYDFDEILRSYCDENGFKYSRYADDIYVSSNTYIPESIKESVRKRLLAIGLELNDEKTWFRSKKGRRQITGLIITDTGEVSIGKDKRESIKKMVYDRIVHGQGDSETILGYLAFLKDVEPATYNRLLIKYTSYCAGDILDAIKLGPRSKPSSACSIDVSGLD